MSYFDDYQKRLNASGTKESDVFKNSTVAFINRTFSNSPNYKIIPVDGVMTECRINNTDSFKTRDMILKPNVRLNVGSSVALDSQYFMITDFVYDNIVSKAKLTICSDTIKWYDKNGILKQYHIVGDTVNRFNAVDKVGTILATNESFFYVQRNADTDTIVPTQRFIIGGKAYSIVGVNNYTEVDSNGVGMTQIAMTITTSNPKDDFVNGIADNSFLHGKDKTNKTSGGIGGALW